MNTENINNEKQGNAVYKMLTAGDLKDKILFVKRDSDEWNYMWQKLAEHKDNKDNKEPTVCRNYGECWQYMDTSLYDEKLKHCFRHRMHPKRGDSRYYIQIEVSKRFNPELHCD